MPVIMDAVLKPWLTANDWVQLSVLLAMPVIMDAVLKPWF